MAGELEPSERKISLLLSFRAPAEVEVTWKSETGTLTARRGD